MKSTILAVFTGIAVLRVFTLLVRIAFLCSYCFYRLFVFGCAGSSLPRADLLPLWRSGVSWRRLLAAVRARQLRLAGSGSQARARQLGLAGSELRRRGFGARASLLRGARTLPGPGVKPVCAALAGGFSPAAPLGKLLSAFKIRPFAQQFFSFPT